MFRLLCCVILTAFIVAMMGCGGSQEPPDLKKPPKDGGKTGQTTPPPKQKKAPSPEEEWLGKTCGQCHLPDQMKEMVPRIQAMTSEEVEAILKEKCLAAVATKPDATFTEDDVTKAVEMHSKMKEKMAEKAGNVTPSEAEPTT